MLNQPKKSTRKRIKTRTNNRWGSEFVKLAADLSGTSASMVYAVLKGRAVSAPVSRAIADVRAQLKTQRRRVA